MIQEWEYELREHQKEVYSQLKRFNVLLAHRRFGKTVFAVILLIRKAIECQHRRPQVHYYAPTYSQAKRVAWDYCKQYTQGTGATYNEAELKVVLPTGAVIQLGSADNPDASRGIYSDYAVLDEPAQMPPRMWSEVLRPALSDRKGGALMIGTPQGRHGLFYDSYQDAENHDDWWRGMYKASETGIVPDDELQAAARAMTRAELLQEFECSFDAAVRGSYFGETLSRMENQITTLVHEPSLPVYCALDLGIADATAVWFFQCDGQRVNCIDYQEYQNTGLPDIVNDMKKRPYPIEKWICPHDINVTSLSTGQTRQETLWNLGVEVVVAPKLELIDAIERTRQFLPRVWFDKEKCRYGLEALRQYRSDWDEIRGVLKLRPLHNWASHGADAMRYLATTDLNALSGAWQPLDYSRTNIPRVNHGQTY